ncbi:hypothetical protein HYV50_04590 [Candidatus Pacearchaeota archaeon]|nr:hypothetical protein [Candidatus Pacearchaeota archaeon]
MIINIARRKVRRGFVDLSGVSGYVEGEHDEKIRVVLRRNGLLSRRNLYTVFDFGKVGDVLETGFTRRAGEEMIYALRSEQLIWDNGDKNSLKVHAKQYGQPGIAVYDGREMIKDEESQYGYYFKNPNRKKETLFGVIELKFSR